MAPSPIPRVEDFIAFNIQIPSVQERSSTCIYYLVKEGRTCTKPNSEPDKARRLRLEIEQSPDISINDLEEYAKASCCARFHRSKIEDCGIVPALVRKWQAEIANARENHGVQLNSLAGRGVNDRSLNPTPPTTQPTSVDRPTRYNTRSRTNTQQALQSTISEGSDDSSTSRFRRHIQKPENTLVSNLMKILTPRDEKPGILYLFKRSASPGFVKIGLTTQSVQSRFSNITRHCGYTPQLLHSFSDVPHVYRVELLVHFELLQHWRMEKRCAGCNTQHKEWFEIDADHAIRTAQQWVAWMQEATPYDRDGILTATWRDHLRQLQAEGRSVTAESLLEMHRAPKLSSASSSSTLNEILTAQSERRNNTIDLALVNIVLQTLFTVKEQLQIQRAIQSSREGLQHTTNIETPLPTGSLTGAQLLRRDTNMSVVSQA